MPHFRGLLEIADVAELPSQDQPSKVRSDYERIMSEMWDSVDGGDVIVDHMVAFDLTAPKVILGSFGPKLQNGIQFKNGKLWSEPLENVEFRGSSGTYFEYLDLAASKGIWGT